MTLLDHTQRCTTVGRTPLYEWWAHSRDLYLTTHNTHNTQTSTPLVGFEPTNSAGERPQSYALDRTATGTGVLYINFSCGKRAAPPLTCPDTKPQKLDMEIVCVCVSQYWWKLYRLVYCVLGHVSSTCANVPRNIVTVNLSLRTHMSARGSECSCQTGGRRRVALAPGRNARGTHFLATGRLHPDCTSHDTSWVHAMSTAN